MNRNARAAVAADTLAILDAGAYTSADGTVVSLAAAVARCRDGTRLVSAQAVEALVSEAKSLPLGARAATVEVHNETTLAGARALAAAADEPVAALNFASAKNPGGGFLSGSEAQEESLARSSGLYPSLMQAWPYYELHRSLSSPLYTDTMILSPACPVFRDDHGALTATVLPVTFITSAAPNAGAALRQHPGESVHIPATLKRRAEGVLALARTSGHERIVLGAWGCGVFLNDPSMVARTFGQLLFDEGWARRFAHVRFSVFDRTTAQAVMRAFCEGLAPR